MKSELLLDSNVFIRLLVRDIESQLKEAKKVFEGIEQGKNNGYVSLLVLNEVIWILDNYYNLPRSMYIPELLKIIALKCIKMLEVDKNVVIEVFDRMQSSKIDFTDIYLFKVAAGRKIVSFDRDFEKLSN